MFSRKITSGAVGGLHSHTNMIGVIITSVGSDFSPGHKGCCPGNGRDNVLISPIL